MNSQPTYEQAAADLFASGYSCAQAVLLAFATDLGLPMDTAARLAGALGGGMSRTGGPCGAVSAALLALGLACASPDPQDKAAKERVYALGRRLVADFAARHGAVSCPDLLGCDLGTPEGMQAARAANLLKTRCPLYVRSAAQIAGALIQPG